jgi:glutamate-1-semialdehyde 2,1-aminomutase
MGTSKRQVGTACQRASTASLQTFHVYFGGRSIEELEANTLKNVPAAIQNDFRQALQVRGVDLMSRCSGVLSGVHTEGDIDAALQAFDGAIKAMLEEGIIRQG